jgi:hypothetical protein
MKPVQRRLTLMLALLLTAAAAPAQSGNWRASSQSARSTTGDIAFAGDKIYLNYTGFIVANIRTLTPPETAAMFEDATGPGILYRTSIPAEKKFLHKSTLCGSEDTQWIVTYTAGKTLRLAFFSSSDMPILTPEALTNNPNLCGTYTYVR